VSVPDFYFFKPQLYYRHLRNGKIESNLISKAGEEVAAHKPLEVDFTCKTSVADYLKNVDRIKECIVRGDFYEMNYCLEFSADGDFDPYSIFYRLNSMAPAPFASFFKFNDRYLMCSSPERFLAKRQDKLVSQPIKGTRKRGAENDEGTVSELMNNEKDRAENVMITDLVRNDLSRVCEPGSVVVDELCKVYSFSHVHQMISSISGELRKNTSFSDILRATFPMGSMTGAPKIQVMKDTETFENFKRGWYSGCVGYLEKGDFDLNVVIRSLQMIKGAGCLHYHVGGAITIDSNAEEEYQECMHKAAGMIQALRG
jgi:para-aminobenzoate synthetase component 1